MRILGIATALMLAFAGSAQAASVDLVWTGTSGLGTIGVGGNSVDNVGLGDTVTLDIVFNLDPGESVSVMSASVQFDADGNNELNLVSYTEHDLVAPTYPCSPFPTCLTAFVGPPLTNITSGVINSTTESGAGAGVAAGFEMGTLGTGPSGPRSILLGTITFQVNGLDPDLNDVSVVFFPGQDVSYDNGGVALPVSGESVSVTAIPEPTTAALLGLGLAGLGLAGRRR